MNSRGAVCRLSHAEPQHLTAPPHGAAFEPITAAWGGLATACLLLTMTTAPPAAGQTAGAKASAPCEGTVSAQVVALNSPIISNRLGATLPNAMIFALAGDVEAVGPSEPDWTKWTAGKVHLKDYKRARPIILRVNRRQCLEVEFRNLVSLQPFNPSKPPNVSAQPSTRATSLHVQGLNWADTAKDDGAWVGVNTSSQAQPGDPPLPYRLYAAEEGEFLLYSTGDTFTSNGGQLQFGLFGAVIVEPEGAEYFRSQVDHEDICLASKDGDWKEGENGKPGTCTRRYPEELPKIDYFAKYPGGHPRFGQPILAMLDGHKLVHSDLTAIIAGPMKGPHPGRFPDSDAGKPTFHEVKVTPDRLQPYREFVIIYHEMLKTVQAFAPLYNASQLNPALDSVSDSFAINYGLGGIGSEILANRFDVGPTAGCTDCKYEEFFLSSWPNGDPAMIVDHAAQEGCTSANSDDYTQFKCPTGDNRPRATEAFFPDDPSNVYHAYLRDHTKFRILHGGSDLHHLHHLHAHQWLHSPNSSSGHYLDSQAIGPGTGFTLETVHGGGGNKNLTVGDSIFHCHFYPHFAAGMWSLWRVHDTFEEGTALDSYPNGKPLPNSRALPDGEIVSGTPTPAIVPLPSRPMAPEPAPVRLAEHGTQVEVCTDLTYKQCVPAVSAAASAYPIKNPGYPFFIPGIGGSRAPHPPLAFALACSTTGEPCDTWHASCGTGGVCQTLDGGLPRHLVKPNGQAEAAALNPLDFSKEVVKANGIELPEDGTAVEKAAMEFHHVKEHPTVTPEGTSAEFRTNGRPAAQGAPYAEPCIDGDGNVPSDLGRLAYWAVDFQTDVVFNYEGWHYPQQRMTALWGDLFDYLGLKAGQTKRKAPQPFFIRANSNDCIHYVLANLVPKTYELDDFQVRTPTDILGQHIHLVKFDVTSSDGAANGWNYEAGTLAPDEVVERIDAFNKGSFQRAGAEPNAPSLLLEPKFIKFFGADPDCAKGNGSGEKCSCKLSAAKDVKGGRWCGAQATVERWYVDPTLNDAGDDTTLRTVFTHDHFGPSTHQQTGLYAALVAEPAGSTWHNNETGSPLGGRTSTQHGVALKDGGPTSWEAVIKGQKPDASYREFLFALQDSALTYRRFPATVAAWKPKGCPAGVACGFCSNDHSVACVTEPSSKLYYGSVCKPVTLPIPGVTNTATLPASCNFVPGIPANDNLFFADQGVPTTFGNIWSVAPGSTTLATLRKVGWDGTLPIDPSPSGIVVPAGGVTAAAAAQTSAQAAAGTSTSATAAPVSAEERLQNKIELSLADAQAVQAQILGNQTNPSQPELITLAGATANFSVNYRNEPIYPRIQGQGNAGDLSFVYQSLTRTIPGAKQPPYPPMTGVKPGDPFTPLLRAYAGDDVQIRVVVGAHQNPHNFHINGGKWLFEPSNVGSGWRATETMGISEHFEFLMKVPTDLQEPRTAAATQKVAPATQPWTDFLYRPTAAKQGQMSGSWGLLRAYHHKLPNLFSVPGGGEGPAAAPIPVCPAELMKDACGAADANGHKLLCYGVVATTAKDIFGATPLTYNTKLAWTGQKAILYLNEDDYDALKHNKAVPGYNPAAGLAEPLVLRAAAGDCIRVTLHNKLTDPSLLGGGFNSVQLPVAGSAPASRDIFVNSNTSSTVGLHPQLVSYNAAHSDGTNAGFNPTQTAAPGKAVTYFWYAGNIDAAAADPHVPVELGATNLLPSDPVNHHPYGLFGALVIEPEGATWKTDPSSNTSATVTVGNRRFREFVLEAQDDTVAAASGTRKGGMSAFNLRSEFVNGGTNSRNCPNNAAGKTVACVLSNEALCGTSTTPNCGFPSGTPPQIPIQTPLFCAAKGDEVRFRLLHPGGAVTNEVFELYGHTIAEEPYFTRSAHCQTPVTHTNLYASQVIDPDHNECPDGNLHLGPSLSEWKGSRVGLGPLNHFDVVVASAGGAGKVPGDYLYRSFPSVRYRGGIWGIFRVTDGDPTPQACPSFKPPGS